MVSIPYIYPCSNESTPLSLNIHPLIEIDPALLLTEQNMSLVEFGYGSENHNKKKKKKKK